MIIDDIASLVVSKILLLWRNLQSWFEIEDDISSLSGAATERPYRLING